MLQRINSQASANLAMLAYVAKKLGSLNEEVVFLGGCATALFITDSGSPDVRATLDVDCIVDVISLGHYHHFEKQLVDRGFKKSLEDDVICRWRLNKVILDVMPTDEKILGFANPWYPQAIKYAISHQLSDNLLIKSVTAPYFLATKLEAFKTRGNGDFLGSHDFEDIITVIDGRSEIVKELHFSDKRIKVYLAKTFADILQDDQFHSALPGHLDYGPAALERSATVLKRIKQIANIASANLEV